MRVLFADCIKSEIGGGHLVLARVVNHFYRNASYGIQPIVLLNDALNFRKRFLDREIKYIPFKLGTTILSFSRGQGFFPFVRGILSLPSNLIVLWSQLIKILKEEKIDLVHTNSMTAFLGLSFPAKFCKVKLIFHLHDAILPPDRGGTMSNTAMSLVLFWMKAFADCIVVVSEFVGKTIISKKPLLSEKIWILHNGLDSTKIRQPSPKVYYGGPPQLIAFGRLDPKKGFDIAIDAISILREKYGCQVKLKIIGDGPIRSELQDQVNRKKLNGQVELLGFKENILEYVAQGDVVVIPSVVEDSLPVAVIEAMANSKIIIASKAGGIPEMITDGKEGFLVPKAKPEAIAEKIIWIIKHPDKANEMAERAYHRVKMGFTIENMASQLVNIYQSLLQINL